MNNATREMINSLAEDIIRAYDIEIPIQDIDSIVEHLGGTIETEFCFSDGTVKKVGNGFKIIVSPFQDERRRRFTIAHELGHLFLHMGYGTNQQLWESQNEHMYHRVGSSEKEYQANEFAAALLMPKDEYARILRENTEGNKVYTGRLAEYFNVSVDAASNRGKFLGFLRW